MHLHTSSSTRPGSALSRLRLRSTRRAAALAVLLGACTVAAFGQNVTFPSVINTIAGNKTGAYTGDGGLATAASISTAVDAATTDAFGNLYIADTGNNVIRRVDAVTGMITTVAGQPTPATLCTNPVASLNPNADTVGDGCPAKQATLNAPKAVRFFAGDMYIADSGNNLVRRVSGTTGLIEDYAGNFKAVAASSGGTATGSPIRSPQDIIFDAAGNLYAIVAGGTPSVVRVGPKGGTVTIVAGTGTAGSGTSPGTGVQATSSNLAAPFGLALDSLGNLYISEGNFNDVRVVNLASGIITIYAGTGTAGFTIAAGGAANQSLLNSPQHIAIDAANNLYIADRVNNRVVLVTPAATSASGVPTLSLYSGNGSTTTLGAGDGGLPAAATLSVPYDVELAASGDVLITDAGDKEVRAVSPTGNFGGVPLAVGTSVTQTVLARVTNAITVGSFGVPAGYADFSAAASTNCAAGTAVAAGTLCTIAVTFTPTQGGTRRAPLVFTDSAGLSYSEQLVGIGLAPAAGLLPGKIGTVAGTGTAGNSGDTAAAAAALVNAPASVAVDSLGNTYIADTRNNEVREVIAASGVIVRIAGTGAAGNTGDGAAATAALLNGPAGIAVDGAGNVYIADTGNNRIRLVSVTTGLISAYAGTGTAGFAGDGGLATAAQLTAPSALALTPGGLLLVADSGNNVIRSVGLRSATITTFAGTGSTTFQGDGGPAQIANLSGPLGVAVDNNNVVYIADTGNNRVRQVSFNATTAQASISTLAGGGSAGFNGDGAALSTNFSAPAGLAADAASNIYVADSGNNRIRQISGGQVITAAGSTAQSFTGDGGPATSAALNGPRAVALDGRGNLLIADTANSAIRGINVAAGVLPFPTTNPRATSAPQLVLLENIGNQALNVASVTLPTPFTDSPTGSGTDCTTAALTLTPAANCQISVVFSPPAAGTYAGNIRIADNSQAVTGSAQAIAVSGSSAFVYTATSTLPKTAVAGTGIPFVVSVTNPNALYTGTLHLTSSDKQAVLPANYTFTAADNGTHTFTVQLATAGIQTVTATDTVTTSITTTSSTTVGAGAAARLAAVSGTPQSANILGSFTAPLVVQAFDAFGNSVAGVVVTFTAPAATGASGAFAGQASTTATTGVAGTAASSLLTANAFAGSFTVQATAAGVATPVSFAFTNTVGTGVVQNITISTNPAALTVSPGGSGSVPVSVLPGGGLSAAIQVTCTTSNPVLTCALNPATVSPNASGAPVATTLTVTAATHSSQLFTRSETVFATLLPLGMLVFFRKRRKLAWPALALVLLAALGATSGCGGSSTGLIAGNYNVTVTATSGTVTSSANVLVYVTGYPGNN